MECPECKSNHINKNGHKKVSRIIFVLTAEDNLSTVMNQNEGTIERSNRNVSQCM
jgi:hypothetical protein